LEKQSKITARKKTADKKAMLVEKRTKPKKRSKHKEQEDEFEEQKEPEAVPATSYDILPVSEPQAIEGPPDCSSSAAMRSNRGTQYDDDDFM
jgi:hypothetical protein